MQKLAKTKDNNKPVSMLSNISRIYERLMFKQISEYFKPILWKFQCGSNCLLAMLEKWKSAVDDKGNLNALVTVLPKTFDCLPHDLLLANLSA